MSKASDQLEAQTEGDVPTAEEVIAATGAEASEADTADTSADCSGGTRPAACRLQRVRVFWLPSFYVGSKIRHPAPVS